MRTHKKEWLKGSSKATGSIEHVSKRIHQSRASRVSSRIVSAIRCPKLPLRPLLSFGETIEGDQEDSRRRESVGWSFPHCWHLERKV